MKNYQITFCKYKTNDIIIDQIHNEMVESFINSLRLGNSAKQLHSDGLITDLEWFEFDEKSSFYHSWFINCFGTETKFLLNNFSWIIRDEHGNNVL
jgi:hypothetical protein